MLRQLPWLAGVLLVLCCVALNPRADRVMCAVIGSLLARTHGFGVRDPVRLLQMPAEYGVTRILVHQDSGLEGQPLRALASDGVLILGLEREDGTFSNRPDVTQEMAIADEIFVYGSDDEVSALVEAAGNTPPRQR